MTTRPDGSMARWARVQRSRLLRRISCWVRISSHTHAFDTQSEIRALQHRARFVHGSDGQLRLLRRPRLPHQNDVQVAAEHIGHDSGHRRRAARLMPATDWRGGCIQS